MGGASPSVMCDDCVNIMCETLHRCELRREVDQLRALIEEFWIAAVVWADSCDGVLLKMPTDLMDKVGRKISSWKEAA